MVSNYKRKTNKGSYSKETLRAAVQAVKNGHVSGYKAAQIYNIPRMTIMDHVYNRRIKSTSLGRNTALTLEVEANLVSLLHLMEKNGFGLSKEEVLQLVGDYVKKNSIVTPFRNGIPGGAWFAGFKVRHNLSIKKPQGVEHARKKAIDPFIVFPYFDLLWKTMNELNILDKPSAIWNLDETSFSQDPSKTKVVGIKGHASTRLISSPGRNNTTVLLGASANGDKTPPLIIFKGKNVWDEWVSPNAYPGTTYAATKNGWMQTDVFEMFFKKSFLKTVGNQRPILLIYDGHATHVGLNIIEEARKSGITILKLPSHTSHVLQPLDVAVIKSFKDRWDPLLVKWQRSNVGVSLPKKEFARLIGVVWAQIERTTLVNGFRKSGIFPWNPDQIKNSQYDVLKYKKWKELKEQNKLQVNTNVDYAKKSPPSLLSIALDFIRKEMLQSSSAHMNLNQDTSENQLSEPSVLLNKDPKQNNKKITILEDRAISFEKLLLLQIKPGNNRKVKRQKIAPGAEVITHDDVVKRKQEKKSIKTGLEARKIKIQPNKSKKLKNKQTQNRPTEDITTPVQIDDIYSSSNKYEYDKENTPFTNINDSPYVGPSTSTGISDSLYLGKSTATGIRKTEKKKRQKNKRVQKESSDTSSISDCISIHSDSDIYDCSETFDIHDFQNSIQIQNDQNKETENDENAQGSDLELYKIDDHVMVRYYNRKKWTYYVGYIENIIKNDDEETLYSIKFYKTLKNNKKKSLKFVMPKKVDRDDVPILSLVKKVEMRVNPNNCKEMFLSNNEHDIYFL